MSEIVSQQLSQPFRVTRELWHLFRTQMKNLLRNNFILLYVKIVRSSINCSMINIK